MENETETEDITTKYANNKNKNIRKIAERSKLVKAIPIEETEKPKVRRTKRNPEQI